MKKTTMLWILSSVLGIFFLFSLFAYIWVNDELNESYNITADVLMDYKEQAELVLCVYANGIESDSCEYFANKVLEDWDFYSQRLESFSFLK